MNTSRYIPISKAAKQASTSAAYLHKLREAGKLPAIFEQRGTLKYWLIDTESERYKKLLSRHEKQPVNDDIPTNHPVDWTLWEDMCRAGEEIVKDACSEQTIVEYKRYAVNFFKTYQELTRDSLRAALTSYERREDYGPERDYYTSRRMLHQSLMTVARYYVFKDYETPEFVHNLAFLRPKQKVTSVSHTCHSEQTIEEALKVIETAKTKKKQDAYNEYNQVLQKIIIQLAFETGARSSELCNIHLKHIDWVEKSILLHGKGGKKRYVGFSLTLEKLLKRYISYRPNCEHPNLLINSLGNPFNKDTLGRRLRNLGRKYLNSIRFNPHSLRHSAATHMLMQRKWPMPAVRDILGHSTLAVTNRYAQPTASDIIKLMREGDAG